MSTRPPLGQIPPAWLRSGYEKALADLHAALGTDDEASYHALFATLNWAASIRYYSDVQRSAARDDDTVAAVQFVRNRVHHGWADAIALMAVFAGPRAHGRGRDGGWLGRSEPAFLVTGWVWPQVADLPPGKYDYGRAEYERDLEGKPVTDALDLLAILYRAHL